MHVCMYVCVCVCVCVFVCVYVCACVDVCVCVFTFPYSLSVYLSRSYGMCTCESVYFVCMCVSLLCLFWGYDAILFVWKQLIFVLKFSKSTTLWLILGWKIYVLYHALSAATTSLDPSATSTSTAIADFHANLADFSNRVYLMVLYMIIVRPKIWLQMFFDVVGSERRGWSRRRLWVARPKQRALSCAAQLSARSVEVAGP